MGKKYRIILHSMIITEPRYIQQKEFHDRYEAIDLKVP